MTLKFDSWWAAATAYATFTTPTSPVSPLSAHFLHAVKLINPKNNKSATILALLDTGAEYSLVHHKFIQNLGLDLTKGQSISYVSSDSKGTAYRHNLQVQIGTLKPITMPITIYTGTVEQPPNMLGWGGLLKGLKFEISGKKLTYIELAQAALGSAQAYFRSRF